MANFRAIVPVVPPFLHHLRGDRRIDDLARHAVCPPDTTFPARCCDGTPLPFGMASRQIAAMMAPCPDPEHAADPNAVAAQPLRVVGHFGEFLQGRIGTDGPVAVVSAPCPVLGVTAWAETGPGTLPRGGEALLKSLDLPVPIGRIGLRADMPPGGGAGSSTATLVALARLAGWNGPPEHLATACVLAEGASDPLMFPQPERVLFASRLGRVLTTLPALPVMTIVGGFWGCDRPTDPDDHDFPDITDLVAAWQAAAGDLQHLATLAAKSARRTLGHRGPAEDPTEGLARAAGAAGWLIAHTGSARGLIFAPGTVPAGLEMRLASAGFRQVIRFEVGG